MAEPIISIGDKQYLLKSDERGKLSLELLLKSNGEPPRPLDTGGVFLVYRDDIVMGWVQAMTAWQALTIAFGHPHNPRYRAISWECSKHEARQDALDEGRIEGRIWEGCPDCQALIDTLNEQIVKLTDELARTKSIEIVNLSSPSVTHAR